MKIILKQGIIGPVNTEMALLIVIIKKKDNTQLLICRLPKVKHYDIVKFHPVPRTVDI